ncbi:MAG: hypothetical protein H8K07_07235 [Nitrospira sp.]|nr:hypothetical protein [Nitrospira sp.]
MCQVPAGHAAKRDIQLIEQEAKWRSSHPRQHAEDAVSEVLHRAAVLAEGYFVTPVVMDIEAVARL